MKYQIMDHEIQRLLGRSLKSVAATILFVALAIGLGATWLLLIWFWAALILASGWTRLSSNGRNWTQTRFVQTLIGRLFLLLVAIPGLPFWMGGKKRCKA